MKKGTTLFLGRIHCVMFGTRHEVHSLAGSQNEQ